MILLKFQESEIMSGNNVFGDLTNLEIEPIEHVGKDGPGNPEEPSNKFLKILNMASISCRKHEMTFWQDGTNIFHKPESLKL